MDERESNEFNNMFQKSNPVLRNTQVGPLSGNVAPPMPSLTTMPTSPLPPATNQNTAAGINMVPRNYRRVPVQYAPSTTNPTYNGAYGNYPINRPYMNMGGGYNPYGAYGQSITNQFQNPVVIAAAENSRPAFESIQSLVQSFNSISMMLESTFTAMHMSFQALLGVAENFTRLRMFMVKLYSTIVTFKLVRWFLNKMFYFLRLVKGRGLSNVDEDLWTTLSSTTQSEITPSNSRSWPLVVFTGLLVATPYFVYKLLNSVTPISDTSFAPNTNYLPVQKLALQAPCDWSSSNPNTIPLVKGQTYLTSRSNIDNSNQNGGWVLVENSNGYKGYVPIETFKVRKIEPSVHQPVILETPNETTQNQIQQQLTPEPITDAHNNPIILPHLSVDHNKLENDK